VPTTGVASAVFTAAFRSVNQTTGSMTRTMADNQARRRMQTNRRFSVIASMLVNAAWHDQNLSPMIFFLDGRFAAWIA
jgi:hypothetical protein